MHANLAKPLTPRPFCPDRVFAAQRQKTPVTRSTQANNCLKRRKKLYACTAVAAVNTTAEFPTHRLNS
jgi:hypothetical protein